MIDSSFEGFRYHKPLPNFYRIENPENPKTEISKDLLDGLNELAGGYNFTGISYSKLNEDFKEEFAIDFENVLIFKFLIGEDLINMEPSREKGKLMDEEFQEYGIHVYEFADTSFG